MYSIPTTMSTFVVWSKQHCRHFAYHVIKCIFLNENVWIVIEILLMFVPKGSINNIPALVQIMAWRRPGDKPLSEPKMVRLPTHICVTQPQWVNCIIHSHSNKCSWKCFFAEWQPFCSGLSVLTHCGLGTPYGDIDLGQLWLRWWLVAWWHQTFTWTNVDYHR